MKKLLLLLSGMIWLSLPRAGAQSFSVAHDTVSYTILKTGTPANNITNVTGSNVAMTWHVVSTDFPVEWQSVIAFGICDNATCINNVGGALWSESTSSGNTYSATYYANSTHDSVGGFGLSLDFSKVATLGTHYVTVNLKDMATGGASKNITFKVSKLVNTVSTPSMAAATGNAEINVYPNPAGNELNVVYDEASEVKNITVHNIIGNVMAVYKVAGDSANLNLESIPSGIYFVRLYSNDGHVVATKKFTKQ